MHAFLLIGAINSQQPTINSLAKKLGAKALEYPLAKIEDTRELNNLIRLSFNEPTLIVCKNIHTSTEEALNAFLKNLEEPQENIYFALTAPSVRKVLPTITSRCEIIRIADPETAAKDKQAEEFLKMNTGEKLSFIDKIKDREEAQNLVEDTVYLLHNSLHEKGSKPPQNEVKYGVVSRNIELANQTLTRLKANGNVNLQLAVLAINLK